MWVKLSNTSFVRVCPVSIADEERRIYYGDLE